MWQDLSRVTQSEDEKANVGSMAVAHGSGAGWWWWYNEWHGRMRVWSTWAGNRSEKGMNKRREA